MTFRRETKRERRIRDRRRMVRRAWRVAGRWAETPAESWWNAPRTWEEVFARRRRVAVRTADNLKVCSAACCGNGRRHSGDTTVQEWKGALDAVQQMVETGMWDDGPCRRRVRRGRFRV